MKFKETNTDEYQEMSDSGYNSANSLIYPQTLLEYLNSFCIHMPKTGAHSKQVLGQPELRVSVQVTCKSICMPSGKSALSDLQERRTQAAFLTPKSSTFPSSATQSQGLVFTPGNFWDLYCLRLHLRFATSAIDFHIHTPLWQL